MAKKPEIGILLSANAFWAYGLLIFFGHIRDFLAKWFSVKTKEQKESEGYSALIREKEDFFTRRMYHRIHDCWNRPIASCPGAYMDVMERQMTSSDLPLKDLGTTRRCLNLGSYNYLGFGDPNSPVKPHVLKTIEAYPLTTGSQRTSLGTTTLHKALEQVVARFVGKDDAMVVGMGFATNANGIPALIGRGGLIVSDSNNHTSIVIGARFSGAKIKVFKHNDVANLESVLRQAICDGQPRTHRPWTKILIVVEGIYSMEGEMCPLKEIVALKKKYKCYLYVDEAHSVGAIGKRGRGICDHANVNPDDVDILMGTFTKSFGSVGGYIAGSRDVISFLRKHCGGHLYSPSLQPAACQQVISAMKLIMGEDGTNVGAQKLKNLKENSNYFRKRMQEIGCHVLGDMDSPIVPILVYHPSKVAAFSRECLARNLAVVVVGFPATPLLECRTRFCISAAHTIEDLEDAAQKIEEVADLVRIRYAA